MLRPVCRTLLSGIRGFLINYESGLDRSVATESEYEFRLCATVELAPKGPDAVAVQFTCYDDMPDAEPAAVEEMVRAERAMTNPLFPCAQERDKWGHHNPGWSRSSRERPPATCWASGQNRSITGGLDRQLRRAAPRHARSPTHRLAGSVEEIGIVLRRLRVVTMMGEVDFFQMFGASGIGTESR
ncbi:hypothetical protein [Acidipropionibacterium thoenii]|uniref:hypothetical protein n=1 Tax=Acidipropionibacterium thoenii TaxID=1751 RepID=UPI00047FCE37|nr:hypothetical protein [Acidipropionibacterium thoenii]